LKKKISPGCSKAPPLEPQIRWVFFNNLLV
jgi:hypothetical protein